MGDLLAQEIFSGERAWRALDLHRCDHAVAEPGQGFDVSWPVGGIAQDRPQLFDRGVETVLEIDKGVGRPKLAAQLFATYGFAGMHQQDLQDPKRLGAQANPDSMFIEFARSWPQFVGPE